MNTTTRSIAGIIAGVAAFSFAACGTEVDPPAQDIGGASQKQAEKKSGDSHWTENSAWMRKGGSTGDRKAPPDSRP